MHKLTPNQEVSEALTEIQRNIPVIEHHMARMTPETKDIVALKNAVMAVHLAAARLVVFYSQSES